MHHRWFSENIDLSIPFTERKFLDLIVYTPSSGYTPPVSQCEGLSDISKYPVMKLRNLSLKLQPNENKERTYFNETDEDNSAQILYTECH